MLYIYFAFTDNLTQPENDKKVLNLNMRKLILLLFFGSSVLLGSAQSPIQSYEIDDDGIAVEKFDSTNISEYRFTDDNVIYKKGRKFTFSYYYVNKFGVKFLMTKGSLIKEYLYDWTFEKFTDENPNSANLIILTVNSGHNPFLESDPNYNQTVIDYNFKQINGEQWVSGESTGVIENIKNVWMHPPRTDLFKILELNPFPYIKQPYEVGNTWTWKLKFGSHWADKRWLMWEGSNENKCNYKITDKIKLNTKLGELVCFVIEGNAISKIGQTKLTSYFNTEYGFVKLDYLNIDGSRIMIELLKVE
jgi:hypothetical protein